MKTAVWDLKSQYDTYRGKDVFDCMIVEHLLCEGRYSINLDKALQRHGVANLEELAKKQQSELEKNEDLNALFTDVEMPLVPILAQMEKAGISLDRKKLQDIGEQLKKEISQKEQEILSEVGTQINLSSPAQVGSMLVAKWNVSLKKTATGQYATGERELAPLAPMYPIINSILKYRELTKLTSTYIDPLITKIAPDGRIHTTYSQASVITGRLSSAAPNLQNIPPVIKPAFIAAKGHILASFDYSQQELRILAHLTKEKKLLESFSQGRDIHKVTASNLFGTAYEQVTKEQRHIAKTINFGIVYGMGSFGLSQQMSIPVDEATKFINNFYKTFPNIKTYFDKLLKNAPTKNCIETIMGRRRYVFAEGGKKFIDNALRRELINFPMQGSAADMVKKAMVDIDKQVIQTTSGIAMLLQIHDELVFEIQDTDEARAVIPKIQSIMQQVYPLDVPMDVEVKVGTAWGLLTPQ